MSFNAEEIRDAEARITSLVELFQELREQALRDGTIDPTEQQGLDRVEAKIDQLQDRITQLRAVSEDVEADVAAPGQVREHGVGPSVTLEEELGADVTGHLDITYSLTADGSQVAHGRFLNGGTVERDIVRGQVYELIMEGTVTIYDPNFIMNNTSNGQMITVRWRMRAPETGETGADPSVEIIGRPEVRPTSGFAMTDGRTEWNIAVNDISSSRNNSSQAGLYIRFSKSSTSGYQGSLEAGAASGSYSTGATLNDSGALSVLLRLSHVEPAEEVAPLAHTEEED